MSASRRPTGTTRGCGGTSETTVGRPCGSRAVVTTPAGLCNSTCASGCAADRACRRPRLGRDPDTDACSSPARTVHRSLGRPGSARRPAGARRRRRARGTGSAASAHRRQGSLAPMRTPRSDTPARRPRRRLRCKRPARTGRGVTTYTGKEELTREVVRAAYRRGARWVDVVTLRPVGQACARRARRRRTTLEFVPPWMMERLEWLSDEHAAASRSAGRQSPLRSTASTRPGRAGTCCPYIPNSSEVVNRRTTSWCVAPAPTRGWAQLVYPDLPPKRRTRSSGMRWRTSVASTPTIRPRLGGSAWSRVAGLGRPAHGAPLRRRPPPRPGDGPHGRTVLARRRGMPGASRHGRRRRVLLEHSDRGDVHHARSARVDGVVTAAPTTGSCRAL